MRFLNNLRLSDLRPERLLRDLRLFIFNPIG